MFDLSQVPKRYFEVRLTPMTEDGSGEALMLQVEPCKYKLIRKMTKLAKEESDEAVDGLRDCIAALLSKNKAGHKVPVEYIDEMDFDQLVTIVQAYLEWLKDTKTAKN